MRSEQAKREDSRLDDLADELLGRRNPEDTEGRHGRQGDNPHESRDSTGRQPGDTGRQTSDTQPFAPPDYPIDALGPLAAACRAIADEGQLDAAMAGQCLLSVAALVAQQCADVRTMEGIKPLSLYMLTVGESGDGKSTAENAALAPVREFQREGARIYAEELHRFEAEMSLRKKGQERPIKPREPYIIATDCTVEGIRRGYVEGRPSQGVFTSEAAVMLSGYGMNADNRGKSAGAFNSLWDRGEVSVARGTAGRIQLYDRRLSLHWLIQPEAATESLSDPLLSSIGFWPRFLAAWPSPARPRIAKPFKPAENPDVLNFWSRCRSLLNNHLLTEDCSGLPVIESSPSAHALASRFFERMEQASKTSGGVLAPIRPFGIRATELMFRVAGVLACFDDKTEIDADTMRGAAELVGYSLEIWSGIFGERFEHDSRNDADILFAWLARQPGRQASERTMLRIGPKSIRSRSRRDTALATLESQGRITPAIEQMPDGGFRTLSNTWRASNA
ncbi:DUF3987 domain-containing protein [Methylococcus capsulatus]|uniref:DUF3987 domain-containing protein n=1 Tax=Methylococcus capsulatus TaxID=414 RepID=UPI001C531A1F|nr:DUF3987 domain-containing protein [Methylococcus capsulatus]QXP94370.1 DUF3987 domain-containing protein [Methylococcus capsulatus]